MEVLINILSQLFGSRRGHPRGRDRPTGLPLADSHGADSQTERGQ